MRAVSFGTIALGRSVMTWFKSSLMIAVALMLIGTNASASTTGRLPQGVCTHPDTIYAHGFEAQPLRYFEPSNGSGGPAQGGARNVLVAGYGNRVYYVDVPASYSPSRPMPMLLVLHGTGGPGTADYYASLFASLWASVSANAQIIVVAAVGSGQDGGWIVPPSNMPTDYDMFRAILADMKSAYNIDGSRIHGWGYSSGGSVMNDLVFGPYSSGINIDTFAGLGNWAGGLDGLACSSELECVQLIAAAPRMLPIDLHVGVDDDASRPHVLADYSRFQNAGWVPESNLWYRETPYGHEFRSEYFPEIWDHLCPFQRLP